MSILSPTRIKSMPVIERTEVVSDASGAVNVIIPVEYKKVLELVVVNKNATTDYAGASIAVTGKDLGKTAGVWLSPSMTGYSASELTNNTVSLKKGTTSLKLSDTVLASHTELTINAVGTADSHLYVYAIWTDPAALTVPQWQMVTAAAPFALDKTTEKNWRITVIPKGVDDQNTVNLAMTASWLWWSNNLKSEDPIGVASNVIKVTKRTVFYADDIYQLAALRLSVTATGTASAAIMLEDVATPADTKTFWKTIFETAASIGDAYFFKPDFAAQNILCRVDATIGAGGSASVKLVAKNSAGNPLAHKFTEFGSGIKANDFAFAASGTRHFILPRYIDIAQVHASTSIVGSDNSIRVSFTNGFADVVGEDELAAPLYSAEGFLVAKHASQVVAFAAYENWTAAINTGGVLTVSNGSTAASIALTSLPGWKNGDLVGAMGFIPFKKGGPDASGYSRETAMRLCFFTRLGNIYHNYPAAAADDKTTNGGIVDFDLSAIYEPVYRVSDNTVVSSARIPSNNAALTVEENKVYRYEPGLPAWNYEQHTNNVGGLKADGSAYGGGGLPPVLEKNGIKLIRMVTPFDYGTNPQDSTKPFQMSGNLSSPFSVKSKCTVFTPYNGVNASKNVVLGTVDGGRIWVVLHELGSTSNLSSYGNNFDYSAIGAYTSGALSVVRRTYIQPTASVKDPANCFQYSDPISVTAITTTAGKASITTAAANGFATGDLICFKKNSAGNYDFLENSITAGNAAAFSSNSAGDGRFYRVKVTGTTTFELLQNYNGLDEKIGTHHIHSTNPAKDGHVICCGEKYPAGWILFVRVPQIDDFAFFDPYTYRVLNRYIYRLNSSSTAMQRAVGMVWHDDKDQSFLFASDEQNIGPRPLTIAGRDAAVLPLRNTAGVFKGKISDIDDITMAEVVCEMEEASLGLVNAQGMYVVLGMSRKTYLSVDARRWASFPLNSTYVGETNGAVFLKSDNTVYRVTKL